MDSKLTQEERINMVGLRPFQRLPMPEPRNFDPGPEFFYDNFVQHFIGDAIEMMCTGLYVNDIAVEELRSTIDEVLSSVDSRMLRNPIIQKYQEKRLEAAQKVHFIKSTEAIRDVEHFYRDYKGDMVHRSWVVNTRLKKLKLEKDLKEKWSLADLKMYNVFAKDDVITSILDKTITKDSLAAIEGMQALAEYKAELWNRPRYDKANSKAPLDPFNPGSAKQNQELFEMLNVTPLAYSKDTGAASWGREYIEQLLKQSDGSDKDYDEILEAIIDHSFSGIIRNNFLKAFDTFTLNGVMHGNIKLFGAKSFRNTSNSPNLLNAPSSKSIYAKPLKRCFVAPEATPEVPKGFIIYAIDLGALEDRVIANLSGDVNKSNIFLEGLDGHSLNACGYFVDEIAEVMGPNTNNVAYVKEFYRLADEVKDKTIGAIRSKSKGPTFKLAYGGYPDAEKGGVITQEIFDNYHNLLYPGITEYRENYVLPTTEAQGYLHLGLGCRIYSDDPAGDIRTLNNATCQFWSILTLIAINEINYRARRDGLSHKVKVCSTIYDSIYFYVENDAETIKWLNDNAVEALCIDYLEDQVVKNEAEGEISDSWTDMIKIKNGVSVEEIQKALDEVNSRK